MFTHMFSILGKGFARSGSHRISPVRSRRTNRRYSFNEGIEGLEGRLAPSDVVGVVTVTVTNQTDPSTDPGDGSDPVDGTVVAVASIPQDPDVSVLS
jgi:hypothetical protein